MEEEAEQLLQSNILCPYEVLIREIFWNIILVDSRICRMLCFSSVRTPSASNLESGWELKFLPGSFRFTRAISHLISCLAVQYLL